MSDYRAAIDDTARTIDIRARYFRNLIIAVVACSLAPVVWAAVTWTSQPLAWVLLLIPVCGCFFVVDARVLDDWRSRLIEAWVKKDIEFEAFRHAMSTVPKLPGQTLRSMLASLPNARDLVSEQGISSSTREGVATAVLGIYALQADGIMLRTTASAVMCGLVVTAAILRTWMPLTGLFGLFVIPLVEKRLNRRLMIALFQTTLGTRVKPGFDEEQYCGMIASLQWGSSLASARDRLLHDSARAGASSETVVMADSRPRLR